MGIKKWSSRIKGSKNEAITKAGKGKTDANGALVRTNSSRNPLGGPQAGRPIKPGKPEKKLRKTKKI